MPANKVDLSPNGSPHGLPLLKNSAMVVRDDLPDVFECTTYLRLLNSILKLKHTVESWGLTKDAGPEESWKQFCSAAANRFLLWSQGALRSNAPAMPALDILMVWQAYMLNPREFRYYEGELLQIRPGGVGINWNDLSSYIDAEGRFSLPPENTKALIDKGLEPDLIASFQVGNLSGLTLNIQPRQTIKFDLVAAVQRQLGFAETMEGAKWLQNSPLGQDFITHAIDRYDKFFTLIAEYPDAPLSPATDIDFVWHTHQLSPGRYGDYSERITGGVFVNHDDTVDKQKLVASFDMAQSLFRQRYGLEYYICLDCTCIVLHQGYNTDKLYDSRNANSKGYTGKHNERCPKTCSSCTSTCKSCKSNGCTNQCGLCGTTKCKSCSAGSCSRT